MYPVSSIVSIDLARVTIMGSSLGETGDGESSPDVGGQLRDRPEDSSNLVIMERIMESL